VTFYEYDALGRVVTTTQDYGGPNAMTTTTTYDDAGNVDTTTGPDGTVTDYTYNAMNRLTSGCHDSTGLNLCTTYTYDRLGRQETVTDAEGSVRRTLYNGFGLPVQETDDDDGLAATVTYRYNDLLDLVQAIDTNGNSTWYTYTMRSEVQTETFADGMTVGYTYDPRGNVDTMALQDGATIDYTYDAANRRNRADFSTGGYQTFAFDDAGRLTQATQAMDGHTTVTGYGYNGVGDVVSTTQQLDAGTEWQTTYVYSYTLGERKVIYPSGAARTYHFDALNRLDAVKRGGETLADYAYNVASRFNTVAYDNGLTNRVDYNPLGWITRTQVYSAGGNLVNYSYGYDLVGNRAYMQRHHKTGQPADVYRYDGLYQLVDAWYGADATDPASITAYDLYQAYDLDTLGNRLVVTNDGAGQSYGPQSGGQLTNPMNRYETVDAATLAYDARGNTLDDGINTYAYDILNRQTVVTNTAAITTEYVYDARGRRVAKVTAGVTVTHYLYDIQYRVLEERDGTGQLLARYTYGAGIDEPLTLERNGQTYYYHRDALGSVTELSDSSGDIVERYEYDVYGAVTIYDGGWITHTVSAAGNPYLFTGRRFDPESGNYYYRARVHSPALGRFLSMDPLGSMAEDYNLYRYVHNNVLNRVDPTGYQDEESLGEHLSKWWSERLLPAVDDAFYHIPSKGYQGWRTASESMEVLWNEKDQLFKMLEEAPSECGGCWSLDAVGWRVEGSGSIIFGLDANLDFLYNLRSSEFGVFLTFGGVVAAGEGLGVTAGPVSVFNLPSNDRYGGGTLFLGASGMAGAGLEADVGIGLGDYGCKPPIAVYVGAGLGEAFELYAGGSWTSNKTSLFLP
jgi:RHS repeat-associated protein